VPVGLPLPTLPVYCGLFVKEAGRRRRYTVTIAPRSACTFPASSESNSRLLVIENAVPSSSGLQC
jgi:hypothetical protein